MAVIELPLGPLLTFQSTVLEVLTSVRKNGQNLQFAHPDLRDNQHVVFMAAQGIFSDGLKYASFRLRDDGVFVRKIVGCFGDSLEYASLRPRNHDDIVSAAVSCHRDRRRYSSWTCARICLSSTAKFIYGYYHRRIKCRQRS